MRVELASASTSVECAAVVRSPAASSGGSGWTLAPPQLTTSRVAPSDSSKASVPAWAALAARACGGGAASTINSVFPAATR